MPIRSTPIESFHDKIEIITESGCWIWVGAIETAGYGVLAVGNKKIKRAHRFSYENYIGDIPEELVLDHLCRVRCCVNPYHLEPVTGKENTLRGINHNKIKTHCKRGHLLSGDNLYINPKTKYRTCKTCRGNSFLKEGEQNG